MAKLFTKESSQEAFSTSSNKSNPEQLIEEKIENDDIADVVEFYDDSIKVSIESIVKASKELNILYDAKRSFESKELSTVEYFTSVENYSFYLRSVANNLGVKVNIPAMEDFRNSYSIRASHEIVMEGFKDFIRNIWEKIKNFFRDFFKRILLFFKRLTNSDLQLQEYEAYIEIIMYKVKNSEKSRVDSIKISSKIPTILEDPEVDLMTPKYLMHKGKHRLLNLTDFIKDFTGKVDGTFRPNISAEINSLILKLKNKDINLEKDEIDSIINNIASTFQTLFTNKTGFYDLPDEVQNEIMNIFTTSEIKNSSFFSAVTNTIPSEALPRNFNLYEVKCDYLGSYDADPMKISILSSYKKGTSDNKLLETISDRGDLLLLYDFYKDFTKRVNTKNVIKIVENFEKEISKFVSNISSSFIAAMESASLDSDDPFADTTKEVDDNFNNKGKSIDDINKIIDDIGIYRKNRNSSNTNQRDNTDSYYSIEIKEKLQYLHKFIMNCLSAIQVLLKEISVVLLGLYQECRYELIKYLYKCAKQF